MTTLRFQPFGVDYFCLGKKFLVMNMVSRNLKVKYRRSILGLFWTLLNPLALAMIFYFVGKVVMRVQIPHYLAFILSGVLPWNFFSQSVAEGMESIVTSWGLISKVPIPLQIFPFVGSLTNFVTFLLSLPILVGVAVFSGANPGPELLYIFLYVIMLFLICYAFALILSVAFVFLRDLRHIISLSLQLWFYGTPVFYSETMIPEKYQWVLYINPVGTIFVGIHHAILGSSGSEHFRLLLISAFWTASTMLLSISVRKKFGGELVEAI